MLSLMGQRNAWPMRLTSSRLVQACNPHQTVPSPISLDFGSSHRSIVWMPSTNVWFFRGQIIYHPQSGWFEDTPLKGGTEAGYPLKGVEEGTSLLGLRSVGGTTTALR